MTRRWLSMGGAAVILMHAEPISAQTDDKRQMERTAVFAIPAQPLDTALAAYSYATATPMIYDSVLTRSRRSAAVIGRMTYRQALIILLRGTGITFRMNQSSTAISISAIAAVMRLDTLRVDARPSIGMNQDPRVIDYIRFVQNDVTRALLRDTMLRSREYRVVVKLSIGNDGAITGCDILISSADRMLNDRFRATVRQVVVGRVPPVIPLRPFRVEFQARAQRGPQSP